LTACFANKPTLLLLDGHNILFGLPDLFAAEYENDHPGKKARQKLTGIVEKLVSQRPNIAAKICFDGPSAEVMRVRSNLEIHFSGGNGRDRADELIVSRLQFKDLQSLDQLMNNDPWLKSIQLVDIPAPELPPGVS
jgi:hypothetical protein